MDWFSFPSSIRPSWKTLWLSVSLHSKTGPEKFSWNWILIPLVFPSVTILFLFSPLFGANLFCSPFRHWTLLLASWNAGPDLLLSVCVCVEVGTVFSRLSVLVSVGAGPPVTGCYTHSTHWSQSWRSLFTRRSVPFNCSRFDLSFLLQRICRLSSASELFSSLLVQLQTRDKKYWSLFSPSLDANKLMKLVFLFFFPKTQT